MEWLIKIINYITGGANKIAPKTATVNNNKPIPLATGKKQKSPNEITMTSDLSDQQIEINNTRSKYITTVKNPDYKIKSGDNIAKIAKKFGIEERRLLFANGLTKETAKKIKPGQTLKIPPTKKIKNVNNLNDVAKAMGVSPNFIKRLKKTEDDGKLGENEFHQTPYKDKAGVLTIGIGHVLKPGDKTSLTKPQVAELCAKDLLKMEENLVTLLGGQKNYDKLPQSIKEALLDMTFNKGTAIIENTPGLLYCLKQGNYEAAINKFTNNKSATTGQEMSGLSKRRLFDISIATKMYNGKIPQSNINTAQSVYNRGIELLRAECKKDNLHFANQLVGYNKDVQSYFGNRIKLVTK